MKTLLPTLSSHKLLFLLRIATAMLVTGLLGHGLSTYFPWITHLEGAVAMLVIAGFGWVILLLTQFIRQEYGWRNYVAILSKLLFEGVIWLIPYSIAALHIQPLTFWFPLTSVILSFSWMLYRHRMLTYRASLPASYTLRWILALGITAIISTTLFLIIL